MLAFHSRFSAIDYRPIPRSIHTPCYFTPRTPRTLYQIATVRSRTGAIGGPEHPNLFCTFKKSCTAAGQYEYPVQVICILYGNMVDFSFIVSLYVSDLPNVTISIRCKLAIRPV